MNQMTKQQQTNDELIDIIDELVPHENIRFFNDEESFEIYLTCFHLIEELMEEDPTLISEEEFDEIFDENLQELMHSHFDHDDVFYSEEEMEEIIEEAKQDYFKHHMPPRSYSTTLILKEPDYEHADRQLDILRNKPQPAQRTKEWYEYRHRLITASNAYKIFGTQSEQNQLIYEKCKPLIPLAESDSILDADTKDIKDIKEIKVVNTNSTLHWGQKYEPLSVKYYEYMYETKVEDFGCIQHEQYSFLGASPDGINADRGSKRYGRMLEIKNIVNREITGIPKTEYWIQMQLQMEVCNFDECDFLETKFIEYADYEAYRADTLGQEDEDEDESGSEDEDEEQVEQDEEQVEQDDEQEDEDTNICLSRDNKIKGEIIYFHTKDGTPLYIYKPLDIVTTKQIKEWSEATIDHYTGPEFNYTFMKTIYWKLEYVSCVLVCRNKIWFQSNIEDMASFWDTIVKERVTGYDHRMPRAQKKREKVVEGAFGEAEEGVCLLNYKKQTQTTVVRLGYEVEELELEVELLI